MNRFGIIALLSIAVLVVGCAEVNVRRVKNDNYDVKGFRYYMPRPYVAVKKEYPVAGGEYFITGKLDASNRVVQIDQSSIPAPLKKYFAAGDNQSVSIGYDAIVMVDRQANGAADTANQPPRTPASAQQPATGQAATPPVVAVQDQWLAGSSVSPSKADTKTGDITIIMKLAKDAGYTAISQVKVALLPVIDGKVNAAKVVLLEILTKDDWSTTSQGVYVATTQGSKLSPGSYTLGLQITGTPKNETQATTHLIHLSKAGLEVAAAGDGEGKKKEESNQKTMSEAGLATSGDPTTNPLQPINDWYDIVLLPDFDQQYAVEIKAGLGKAGAQIGLENGWMLERANVNMDNSEMGRFVFESIEKVLDLGLAILAPGSVQTKSAAELLEQTAKNAPGVGDNETVPADSSDPSQRKVPVSVTLKVTYVAHATPGLYPILKSSEKLNCKDTQKDVENLSGRHIYIPLRPYTVVAYNVRETIRIEYISAVPARAQGREAGTAAAAQPGHEIKSATWNGNKGELEIEFDKALGSGDVAKSTVEKYIPQMKICLENDSDGNLKFFRNSGLKATVTSAQGTNAVVQIMNLDDSKATNKPVKILLKKNVVNIVEKNVVSPASGGV